jgi:hypothetical protein
VRQFPRVAPEPVSAEILLPEADLASEMLTSAVPIIAHAIMASLNKVKGSFSQSTEIMKVKRLVQVNRIVLLCSREERVFRLRFEA